jgi:hypothetical protein
VRWFRRVIATALKLLYRGSRRSGRVLSGRRLCQRGSNHILDGSRSTICRSCGKRHLADAQALFQRSLAICEETGARDFAVRVLHGLGSPACALGVYEVAQQVFGRALQIAEVAGFRSLIVQVLTGWSSLLIARSRMELAAELLVVVLRERATDRETSDAAQALLVCCEAIMLPADLAQALKHGQALTLEQSAGRLCVEMA